MEKLPQSDVANEIPSLHHFPTCFVVSFSELKRLQKDFVTNKFERMEDKEELD